MKDQNFWFKYLLIFIPFLICLSLAVAWTASHFYADQNNKKILNKLSLQSETYRSEVVGDLRFLISDLIALQTKKMTPESSFSILMTINRSSRKIEDVRPKAYSKMVETLKNISVEQLDHFPVSFYPIKLSWKDQNYVAILVDVDQINTDSLPSHLSKGKILLGVLTSNGLLRLSRFLRNGDFAEAFILDRKSDWFHFHSNIQYSGHFLSSRLDFSSLKKKYPKGWNLYIESENILSSGIKMGVSDAYLILNKKANTWNQYFVSLFESIFFVIFGVGFLFFILTYLSIHPLLEAYRYLSRLFNRYTSFSGFPVPEYRGYNAYIHDIQPNLKKLFWKLREEKLFGSGNEVKAPQFFSEWIKILAEKIQSQYPKIKINIQSKSDARLPRQVNWLEQAMLELLKNAVECMNSEGTIDIFSYKEGQMFCCGVRDYGPGMSLSRKKQACDAYFTSKPNASGLGLTLAHSALSRMGGILHLSNARDGGEGLIAQISLPLDILKAGQSDQDQNRASSSSFSVTELR